MTIYKESTEVPKSVIYPTKIKSSLSNIWKGLFQTIGANFRTPFVVGKRFSASLNFGATTTTSDLTIDCEGAQLLDQVILGSPAPPAKGFYTAFVSAADVVTVRLGSVDGTSLNPAEAVFTVTVIPAI